MPLNSLVQLRQLADEATGQQADLVEFQDQPVSEMLLQQTPDVFGEVGQFDHAGIQVGDADQQRIRTARHPTHSLKRSPASRASFNEGGRPALCEKPHLTEYFSSPLRFGNPPVPADAGWGT